MREDCKQSIFCWWLLWIVLLGGCVAMPAQPSAEHSSINYQKDVVIKNNHILFGFRPMPVRNEKAEVTEKINKPPIEVSQCLQHRLESQFKLPPEFYAISTYANNSQTIALINPFTKTEGLQMDIIETGVGSSVVKLYANGTVLSKAWKQFPLSCGVK